MSLTLDRNPPNARPLGKLSPPSTFSPPWASSSSQHAAAAAINPVTHVALVYAKHVAMVYSTAVLYPESLIAGKGRAAMRRRARIQLVMPCEVNVNSEILPLDRARRT